MGFSFGQLFRIFIQGIIAIPAWAAIFGAFSDMSSAALLILVLGVTYVLILWLAIAVHELGHAAAAVLTGQRISTIAAWPVDYQVRSRTFGLSKWMMATDIGGFVRLEPDQWPTFRQHVLFIIGGVAANLLTSTVLFAIVNVLGIMDMARSVGLILTAFALVSLGMALGNAIPVREVDYGVSRKRSDPILSDGAQLIDAIRTRRNSQWRRWT